MHRSIAAGLLFLCLCSTARAQLPQQRDTRSDTWSATDALGRTLPGYVDCGPPRPDKTVGIFYFLWMQPSKGPVYDISKLLLKDPDHPAFGPPGAFHWWGEPQLGYYQSIDEFVIRRHARMLSDAGVDVIILDVTNGFTYDTTFLKLCEVYEQIRSEGGRTPQIAFITHAGAGRVSGRLYDNFYSRNLYHDLWFRWRGRPLLLGPPDEVDPRVREFFTVRQSWAWTDAKGWFGDGKDKWPWLDHTPQKFGWHENPDRPEAISVAVAEHPISDIGRSFHAGHEPPPAERHTERGAYFAEQWDRALKVNPQFVFVTGWNEWIAQRFIDETGGKRLAGRKLAAGDSFFVDEYNQEFSRDIEPMRGGHGDDYYYQLASYIRRYKGARPPPRSSPARTIAINRDFTQWDSVRPEYLDDLFDTSPRDHAGFSVSDHYANTSGRNDLDTMKVSSDGISIYFYVRTRDAITEPSGASWMLLLLDTDRNHATGWEGYDFLINRSRSNPNICTVERNVGGWKWQKVGDARLERVGNQMHLAVPRTALGLDGKAVKFDFKWADNLPDPPSAADFLDQGDVAPNGRFNYRYGE